MNDLQYKLIKALAELASNIKKEIIARMGKYGYNQRAGRNTLVGSDLEKSVDVKVVSDHELVFEIADYYEFIVRGWKRTGNYPGTMRKFIVLPFLDDYFDKWADEVFNKITEELDKYFT